MSQTLGVEAVRVMGLGLGPSIRIDRNTYLLIAGEALRPFRSLTTLDRPDFSVLADMRRNAIRQGVLGHLQGTGELYPTE